ncbi:MAG: MBL fold metallo-hydrolase [Betaproteobacteria bacterium]|nr:MAG: MBL fold metallo-hydrolase [Betaproteobacteria bacterium]
MGSDLDSPARRNSMSAPRAGGLGLAGGVFSNIRTAPAPALAGVPPEVDSLSVRVVTDSYHQYLEPSRKVGAVSVDRFQRPPSTGLPRTLQNEWGLALHLESARGAETRQVLVDFGFTGETLNNNLDLLAIDLEKLDALLLTHGHYDHFGGMVGFLAAHARKLKPALPFYLGGEECFCSRETGAVGAPSNFGALSRRAIAEAGLQVLFAERPSLLADHGFTTGHIPLESFEKPAQPSRMKIGMQDGIGCAPEGLPLEKRNLTIVPDDFHHEHATCYNIKGKGLVVMTSCGHRGVVNSVRGAIKVSGISKIHAIIGGFHLMPMPLEYVRSTVIALKEFNPDYLIPMHCTGTTFYETALQELPGRVLLSSTGTRFTFGG